MTAHGIVLAAGGGERYGRPKALVESWLSHAVEALAEGGCDRVTVVLGAAADEARELVGPGAGVVIATHWREGISASLHAGLEHADPAHDVAVVHLVDLPGVGAGVVARVLAATDGAASLVRATYQGRPGHPVVIGRDHWQAVIAATSGDHGAAGYLTAHGVTVVECSDLSSGDDVDSPDA